MNINIDGKYYYNPCSQCKEDSCYSCLLNFYKENFNIELKRRREAEYRVENELEPRIRSEKNQYDRWVSQNTGERQCESFSDMIDDLIEFVEDPENRPYMEWDDAKGNLEQKILFLVRNRVDDDLFYIEEKCT